MCALYSSIKLMENLLDIFDIQQGRQFIPQPHRLVQRPTRHLLAGKGASDMTLNT